jgi:hypothetical protein
MQPHMENPPLAKRGVPETDLAGALINSEYARRSFIFKSLASFVQRRDG